MVTRDIVYDLTEGDIAIANSNEIHQIIKPKQLFQYYFIIISHQFCLQNGIHLDDCIFEPLIQDHSCQEELNRLIYAFKEQGQQPFGETQVHLSLLSFLVYLTKHHLVNKSLIYAERSNKSAKIATRAIKYIRSNFTKQITVEHISQELFVSRYHLSRVFKQYTDYSIVSYFNRLRCDYAYKLLNVGQHSISEICKMCGFHNVSYFDKVFKEVWGILPSEAKQDYIYRKKRLPVTKKHIQED